MAHNEVALQFFTFVTAQNIDNRTIGRNVEMPAKSSGRTIGEQTAALGPLGIPKIVEFGADLAGTDLVTLRFERELRGQRRRTVLSAATATEASALAQNKAGWRRFNFFATRSANGKGRKTQNKTVSYAG